MNSKAMIEAITHAMASMLEKNKRAKNPRFGESWREKHPPLENTKTKSAFSIMIWKNQSSKRADAR